jgi:HSP20 family molecular chaperone IbpA
MLTTTTPTSLTTASPEDIDVRPTIRPAIDIYENSDEFLMIADMPGVDRDAIHLEVDQKTFTVSALRNLATPKGGRVVAGGGTNFEYKRVFELPEAVDQAKISANYRDGVLEVHLPRSEKMRPKRIAISG